MLDEARDTLVLGNQANPRGTFYCVNLKRVLNFLETTKIHCGNSKIHKNFFESCRYFFVNEQMENIYSYSIFLSKLDLL